MLVDVATLSWEDLKKYVYCKDGSLPDILVEHTNRDDWQKWVNFVNANYRVEFQDENGQQQTQVDFASLAKYWDSKGEAEMNIIRVFAGNMQVNCFYYGDDAIMNDIDPREAKSLEDHHQLLDYLIKLSTLLDKEIMLLVEGTRIDLVNQWDPEPLLLINQTQVRAFIW